MPWSPAAQVRMLPRPRLQPVQRPLLLFLLPRRRRAQRLDEAPSSSTSKAASSTPAASAPQAGAAQCMNWWRKARQRRPARGFTHASCEARRFGAAARRAPASSRAAPKCVGASLHWSRALPGKAAMPPAAAARLDLQAQIDPLPIAPLLLNLQPGFGWGGDLTIGARIDMHSTPGGECRRAHRTRRRRPHRDRRIRHPEPGLQRAALRGCGRCRHMEGQRRGRRRCLRRRHTRLPLSAHAHSSAAWPDAATPIEGQLDLRIANLGAWGRWLPAGWRLSGDAHGSASIAGRFGAPEYTGHVEAANLGVRNFLQGVNVTEGSVGIALQGSTPRASSTSRPRAAQAPSPSRAMRASVRRRRRRTSRSAPTSSSCSAASTVAW